MTVKTKKPVKTIKKRISLRCCGKNIKFDNSCMSETPVFDARLVTDKNGFQSIIGEPPGWIPMSAEFSSTGPNWGFCPVCNHKEV